MWQILPPLLEIPIYIIFKYFIGFARLLPIQPQFRAVPDYPLTSAYDGCMLLPPLLAYGIYYYYFYLCHFLAKFPLVAKSFLKYFDLKDKLKDLQSILLISTYWMTLGYKYLTLEHKYSCINLKCAPLPSKKKIKIKQNKKR